MISARAAAAFAREQRNRARRRQGKSGEEPGSPRLLNHALANVLGMNEGNKFDFIFKVVLVGERGAGKSSLTRRLASGTFRADEPPSLGLHYVPAALRVAGRGVKLQLWEASGPSSARDALPCYFRFADAILLVYDCTQRRSFDRLHDWMDTARRFGEKHSVLAVVGAKYDQWERRAVSQREAAALALALGMSVFQTSALSGVGVHAAFCHVAALVLAEAGLARPLPVALHPYAAAPSSPPPPSPPSAPSPTPPRSPPPAPRPSPATPLLTPRKRRCFPCC